MTAEQAAGAGCMPCRNGSAVQLATESQEPAKAAADQAAARPAGGSIFTEQLWKTVGLVPKQLGRAPVQCAANCLSPKTLARASTAGSLARLMSGGSSFGGDGFSALSYSGSAGAISANMPPECINPKTLKMAAIMAWDASHTEASDASGAVSDSTGVSPSGFHPVGRSSSWDHGSDRSGSGTTGSTYVGGQGNRQSSLAPGWSGGWGLGSNPNPVDGYSSAYGGGGAQSRQHGLGARSEAGGGSAAATAAALAAADPADLLECLFCGVATCLPNGPSTVKCSDCQAAMHKDCFVAHYHVVPGRRDWTYCPTHAVAPKNQVPAKPHEKPPSARAPKARRFAKRFRGGGDDGEEAAAARSQRRRRNPEGVAAARRRARLAGPDAQADIGSPSSSDGGGGHGHRLPPPAIQRPRRARAVNYAAMDGAAEDEDAGDGDDRTGGSAAAEGDEPPYRRFELPAQQRIASPPQRVPGSPDSNAASESGSAAQPGSPTAAVAAQPSAPDSPLAPLPAVSLTLRRPRPTRQAGVSPAAAPASPSAQSAAADGGMLSPRSPGSRRPAAVAPAAGPVSPRRATPRKPAAQAATAAEVPPAASERQAPKSPPAKSAADLADEELAMQLHQELNASSRRRGTRTPATTTPGSMQSLDGA